MENYMKRVHIYFITILFSYGVSYSMDQYISRHEYPIQISGVELLLQTWQKAQTMLSEERTMCNRKYERREINEETYNNLIVQNNTQSTLIRGTTADLIGRVLTILARDLSNHPHNQIIEIIENNIFRG